MKRADEALPAGSYGAAVFHAFVFDLDDEVAYRAYVRRHSSRIAPLLAAFLDEHYPMGSLEIKQHVRPLIP